MASRTIHSAPDCSKVGDVALPDVDCSAQVSVKNSSGVGSVGLNEDMSRASSQREIRRRCSASLHTARDRERGVQHIPAYCNAIACAPSPCYSRRHTAPSLSFSRLLTPSKKSTRLAEHTGEDAVRAQTHMTGQLRRPLYIKCREPRSQS